MQIGNLKSSDLSIFNLAPMASILWVMLLEFTLLMLFGQAMIAKAGEPAQEAYLRANQLFIQGKLEQSLEAANQVLRLNPNFVPALTLRAKLSMAFNRLAEAGTDLTRAVELEPKSAYNQFMLGFYYYLENDFKRALQPLNRSAELDEGNSRTYFYLALTHEGLANVPVAIQLYERAIALDREKKTPDLDTLIAFARLLFSLGQYEKCLSMVEQALSLDSKSRDAHYERGRLYLQAGDFESAIQHGERALQVQSPGTTDRQIHFLLVRAYARAGNQQRADEHLAKFKASAPSLRR